MIDMTEKPLLAELVQIDSVRPDHKNARAHNDRNLAVIAASLKRFGQQKPIVVGRATRLQNE